MFYALSATRKLVLAKLCMASSTLKLLYCAHTNNTLGTLVDKHKHVHLLFSIHEWRPAWICINCTLTSWLVVVFFICVCELRSLGRESTFSLLLVSSVVV